MHSLIDVPVCEAAPVHRPHGKLSPTTGTKAGTKLMSPRATNPTPPAGFRLAALSHSTCHGLSQESLVCPFCVQSTAQM